MTQAASEIAIRAPRQPPRSAASGTAIAAATVEPIWMPVVYTPVPVAGFSGTVSRTASGASPFPSPIPTPTPQVRRTTSTAAGASARSRPNTPIRTRPIVIARRVPSRAERYAATGANSPMHSTGIVPRRPTRACDAPVSSWI